MFGAGAWNCRLTWSSGQGTALSLMVVRTGLPRITPCKPRSRMSRSTVHRATPKPSRFICRQTLRTPYSPKLSANTRRISGFNAWSRWARADIREGSRRYATRSW